MPVATVNYAGTFYIHADWRNTPRQIDNASKQPVWAWDPQAFGDNLPNQNPSGQGTFTFNLRFPGQYYDAESGKNYNYFRDYDSSTGRYLESDPIGLGGGINTYGYVGGNPLIFVDPHGTDPLVGLTIGLVSGAFYGGYGAYLGGGDLGAIATSAFIGGAFGAGIGALDPSLGAATYAFVSGASAFLGDITGQIVTSDNNCPLKFNYGEIVGATLGGAIGGAGSGALLPLLAEQTVVSEAVGTAGIASLTSAPGLLLTGAGTQLGNAWAH